MGVAVEKLYSIHTSMYENRDSESIPSQVEGMRSEGGRLCEIVMGAESFKDTEIGVGVVILPDGWTSLKIVGGVPDTYTPTRSDKADEDHLIDVLKEMRRAGGTCKGTVYPGNPSPLKVNADFSRIARMGGGRDVATDNGVTAWKFNTAVNGTYESPSRHALLDMEKKIANESRQVCDIVMGTESFKHYEVGVGVVTLPDGSVRYAIVRGVPFDASKRLDYARKIFDEINALRAAGQDCFDGRTGEILFRNDPVAPLVWSENITTASQAFADKAAEIGLSSNDPHVLSNGQVLRSFGSEYINDGEIVQWNAAPLDSPANSGARGWATIGGGITLGHCRAMMSPRMKTVGIGYSFVGVGEMTGPFVQAGMTTEALKPNDSADPGAPSSEAPVSFTLSIPGMPGQQTTTVVEYLTWDGSRWAMKVEDGRFLHAPDGDWSRAHSDTVIHYKWWDGTPGAAYLLEGGLFMHVLDDDFDRAFNDREMYFLGWDDSPRVARLQSDL